MNSRRLCSSTAPALLPLLAFFFASTAVQAQSVAGFVHAKIQNFQQTSSAAPVANPTQPFQFGSIVNRGTATINSATLTHGGTSSPRAYTAGAAGEFSILDTFSTLTQLNAAYPSSGNYNLTIDTSDGIFSRTISPFPFFGFPPTPQLTLPAAAWQQGVLVIDPTMDYTFTWAPFTNPQATDVIQFAIRGAVAPAPFPASQTSFTVPAGTLQPNTTYFADLVFARATGTSAADANVGAGFFLLVKDTAFMIRTTTPALALASAVSRKTHGTAGTFDVPLPLAGTPAVESRSGGAAGDHTIVFTFSNDIATSSASVTGGSAMVSGTPIISGKTVTVNLTGVSNTQTVSVTLSNITDVFSQALADTSVSVSFLLGDTTGNGSVTSSDIGQVKAESGQLVSQTNFRADVNANGAITSSDVGQVKSSVGTMLMP
jgi:hypothetical protein